MAEHTVSKSRWTIASIALFVVVACQPPAEAATQPQGPPRVVAVAALGVAGLAAFLGLAAFAAFRQHRF